jgi:hypothetical protein
VYKEEVMKRMVLMLTALAILGLGTGTARAGPPYRGYYGPVYAPNYGYQVNNFYGSAGAYSPGTETHAEAVRRIMATHSRYRYFSHPRSMYNSAPTQADYYGWDWGY